MAVFTFLENTNLIGKVIRPFCLHEGSGFGRSIEDIKRICPKAKVEKGMEIHGANIFEEELKEWIG